MRQKYISLAKPLIILNLAEARFKKSLSSINLPYSEGVGVSTTTKVKERLSRALPYWRMIISKF
jgi:hypothetical protein